MSLKGKNVVVTGGSRGLGLGLVEALVDQEARVTVVARQSDALEAVRTRLAVSTIAADARDEAATHRILSDVRPDILVLTPERNRRWSDWTRSVGPISPRPGSTTSKPGYTGCKAR
ncbi:SDR family NAD(P)-dependent oxidoreductase [Neorhizobium galegae]|nr:SDR family NAD(P)-dependent oxidoreductase [Neorhizobium galegae]MCQ1854407.1 SDR family NAD(P)-dependent oxidoreductase [Neorhizobium galegae]